MGFAKWGTFEKKHWKDPNVTIRQPGISYIHKTEVLFDGNKTVVGGLRPMNSIVRNLAKEAVRGAFLDTQRHGKDGIFVVGLTYFLGESLTDKITMGDKKFEISTSEHHEALDQIKRFERIAIHLKAEGYRGTSGLKSQITKAKARLKFATKI